MTTESDMKLDTLGDQLDNFEDRLAASADDVALLADVQRGITGLLASNGGNEAEIRRVLQERYEAGALRQETFQLVKSMLDRFASDDAVTSASGVPPAETESPAKLPSIQDEIGTSDGDDAFGTTTVIPTEVAAAKTAESRVQVGSLLRDRFLLQEKVSGGSMGVVYKALDRRLAEAEADDPWVAIKVLSPQFATNAQALRALQQEATKGRCLLHPNIVRFIDFDRDDDLYFMVMEWLPGRTLARLLDSSDANTVDQDAANRIIASVGDALEYAHRCGIIHADVKPGNIMIMPNGDAKLFDFGVARVLQKQDKTDFDPGVLGAMTPAYSSMQVLTGEEPVASDDVFSLACLTYRLLAGHRVFGPRNAAEASQEGMKPQRPQDLSDSQWGALKKALSYARVTRFASVEEFLNAFRATVDEPITLDPSERLVEDRKTGGSRAILLAALFLVLATGAMYQYGLLQPWLDKLPDLGGIFGTEVTPEAPPVPDILDAADVVADPEASAAETAEELLLDSEIPEPVQEPLVDFSTLAPADLEVPFKMGSTSKTNFRVRLREDGDDVNVDFIRSGGLTLPLTLKIDEVGFSGNRSPWAAQQYAFSNDGIVRFPVGQERSRILLTMASDPLREADQLSTLRLRELDSAESELAVIYVTLEDDDQRSFEAQLPANTIAFAASQASIRETDPAVQIDLVRFNPDESRAEVDYTVSDVTATEGEDYFAPGNNVITFGPGQRSARLLIPLVHDALVEGDEAFVIELTTPTDVAVNDVYQRIVVMIRDDEPQTP
ncbi:MAG: protein kinase domain-containing protein [Woeseiaceae bacterium]